MIIKPYFFQQDDVCNIAASLIGKELYTKFDGQLTGGIITEKEAYCGLTDKACHAHLNKRTKRTSIFYKPGGISYVYLCYGIHRLFNIITGPQDIPQAILVRAIKPLRGLESMRERRNYPKKETTLVDGPGKLTQALDIDLCHNDLKLIKRNKIWIEDNNKKLSFKRTPRIGIDYAGEDALLPWRFIAD